MFLKIKISNASTQDLPKVYPSNPYIMLQCLGKFFPGELTGTDYLFAEGSDNVREGTIVISIRIMPTFQNTFLKFFLRFL